MIVCLEYGPPRARGVRAGALTIAPAPWWKADLVLLETPDGVLGYERSIPASCLRVLVNFTGAPVHVPDGGGDVLVSSLEPDPEPRFAGRTERQGRTERLPRARKDG